MMGFKDFFNNLIYVNNLKTNPELSDLVVLEYPFDLQLLSSSKLYEQSRRLYYSIEGKYSAILCSTLRALSTQDLTANLIEYTPSASEFVWFVKNHDAVTDLEAAKEALLRFNEISVFHEQNHRILWRLIPPPPNEIRNFCRYLNFAESIVVVLDMALGDQLGFETSEAFEGLHLIYRPGVVDQESIDSKKEYRQYLIANVIATYYLLEWMNVEDILQALNYVLPDQSDINEAAVERSLELSENFSRITNPEWQQRNASDVLVKLQNLHKSIGNDVEVDAWFMPEDPLDIEQELELLDYIFDAFEV